MTLIPRIALVAALVAVALPSWADPPSAESEREACIEAIRERVLSELPERPSDATAREELSPRDRMRLAARERLEQGSAAEHANMLLHMDVFMPIWRSARELHHSTRDMEEGENDSEELGEHIAEFRALINKHRDSVEFWREELQRGRDQYPGQERWRDRQLVQLDRLERLMNEMSRVTDEQIVVLLSIRWDELRDAVRWDSGGGRERSREERITRLEDEINRLEGHLKRLHSELNALRVEEEWEPAISGPPQRPSNAPRPGYEHSPSPPERPSRGTR